MEKDISDKCASMYKDYNSTKQKIFKTTTGTKTTKNHQKQKYNKKIILCKNNVIFLINSKCLVKNVKIYEFAVTSDIIAKRIKQNH